MLKKMSCVMVLLGLLFATTVQAKELVSIATAMAGGAWYAAGGAIADIINNHVEGVTATAQTTGGAVANAKLLGTKKVQLGITINVIAKSAYEGRRPFKEKYTNIRTLLAALDKGHLQVFTLGGSDLSYVSELKGKKVMVGPPGHGSLIRLRQIFPIMGFTFDDITPVYLPYQQAMAALGDRKVDAVVLYMSTPALPAKQFALTRDLKLLLVKEKYRKAVLAKYPFYQNLVVPKGTYKGQEQDVLTVGTANGVYIDSGVSEALAYKITKGIFENIGRLRASHPSMRNVSLEEAPKGSLVGFHPGVIKYYKEKGVWTEK
jgi:TRAP transporter TAXI family solute receptor